MGKNDNQMSDNVYERPYGYVGVGSDIKWCGKWASGKECMLCHHHADFPDWSSKWHWHYLVSWSDNWGYYYREYAHYKFSWKVRSYMLGPYPLKIKPVRYRTAGLKERDLKQLLKRGCKENRKCRCVSVAQRGSWYCPDCWEVLMSMTKYKQMNIHDIILTDRNELKAEMLMLKLARIL